MTPDDQPLFAVTSCSSFCTRSTLSSASPVFAFLTEETAEELRLSFVEVILSSSDFPSCNKVVVVGILEVNFEKVESLKYNPDRLKTALQLKGGVSGIGYPVLVPKLPVLSFSHDLQALDIKTLLFLGATFSKIYSMVGK